MVGFTKLHSAIIHSSIWDEPMHVRILFVTCMAMADKEGVVSASVGGLAHAARLSRDQCVEALGVLMGPDPDSRDGTTGERLAKIDGGWLLLNHSNYRDRQTPQQAQAAERVRRHREKLGDRELPVAEGSASGPGYVYYAADGSGLCKIGYSVNPWSRIAEHRIGNPAIELLVTERGDMALEHARHAAFAALIADPDGSREWFRLEGALAAHIEDLRSNLRNGTTTRSTTTSSPAASASASEKRKNVEQAATLADEELESLRQEWLAVRRERHGLKSLSARSWKTIENRAEKSGVPLKDVLEQLAEHGWQTWKPEYGKAKFGNGKPEKSGPGNNMPAGMSGSLSDAVARAAENAKKREQGRESA